MPTTVLGLGSPTTPRNGQGSWVPSTVAAGSTLASGVNCVSASAARQDNEVHLWFGGTSDAGGVTLGAGWTSLLDTTINGSGKFRLASSRVQDAVTAVAGNITNTNTWATTGGAYAAIAGLAGTDFDAGGILVTSSTGNGTTLTAPAAATLTKKSHVIRIFFVSGASAAAPSAPSAYNGDGYISGNTTSGSDYSYMWVDDGEYYRDQTPAAITCTIAAAKNWIGVTVVIPARTDNRPIILSHGSANSGSFAGSMVRSAFTCSGMQTSTAVTAMGKNRSGDVIYLFGFENNNGNFSATPPAGHTVLAGPWTGGDRALTGQGIVYKFACDGTVPGTVTYSATGINYYMGIVGVAIRGVDTTNPEDCSGSQYSASSTQTVPNQTADRANALGISFTVAGGNRQDTTPSFTDTADVWRMHNTNYSTTANNSDVRVELLEHKNISAGTWTPATTTQTTNNPRAYLGVSLIAQAPPPVYVLQGTAEADVDVSMYDMVYEDAAFIQGDVDASVTAELTTESLTTRRTGFVAKRRGQKKPKRKMLILRGLNGERTGTIV